MTGMRLSALRRLAPGAGLPALPPADLLLVTSSAEIGLLATPACRKWLQELSRGSPGAPVHVLSIGCAGVAACLLEFWHSDARTANVLVLESPAAWVQGTLDAAGLGAGGDGFQAQDISYAFRLRRCAAGDCEDEDAVSVLHSSLLSRELGLSGTAKLALQLASTLQVLLRAHPGLRMVSFENGSPWSRKLVRLVDVLAQRLGLPSQAHWLASQEVDERHYMAARPLLDLQAHADAARRHPLLLPCLGAGGRVGVVLLGPNGGGPGAEPMSAVYPLDLPPPPPAWFSEQRDPPRPIYAQREYFGRPQFYFRWRLTHGHEWHA